MWSDQPLGYTEPRYDEIDGLAWAWNGGGNDLESVVGSMSPTYDLFSGWRNTRVAANDRLEWTPERLTPRVSSVDFTLEFVGRYDSNDPVIFVGVGNPTVPAANSAMAAGYNSGTLRYLNVDGFTAHDSTLTFPSGVWCHCIMSRYGNRMYSWLRRYDTGAVSRNLNAAPPINVITLSGAPKIFAAKSANSSILSNSSIAKAAIYTRGIPEAEAEDLLRDPWQTFATPRRRLYLVQGTGGAVTGTASITLGAATASGAGTVLVTGAASNTLGTVTLSSAGVVGSTPIIGAAAITLGASTLASAGTISVVGAAAITLDAMTLASAGAVGGGAIAGAASITLDAATAAGVGTVLIAGSASITLGALTTALSDIVGSCTINLGECVVSATAVARIRGASEIRIGSMLASSGAYVPVGESLYTVAPADGRRIGTYTPDALRVIQ